MVRAKTLRCGKNWRLSSARRDGDSEPTSRRRRGGRFSRIISTSAVSAIVSREPSKKFIDFPRSRHRIARYPIHPQSKER